MKLDSSSGGIKIVNVENNTKMSCHHKVEEYSSIKSQFIRDITRISKNFDMDNTTFSEVSDSRKLIKGPCFSVVYKGTKSIKKVKKRSMHELMSTTPSHIVM